MSQASYSKEDRAVIVTLRESGLSWREVATEAGKKLGRTLTAESARFQWKQAQNGAPASNGSPPRKRPTSKAKRVRQRRGHSLEEFRAEFDIAKKIRDKVAELLDGDGEEYWSDDEFRQLCGVSVQNWRRHAELDEFKQYQFRKPGFHAWAPPSIVEEMKEITGHAGH